MAKKFKTAQRTLDKLLEEATVDCYDDEEQFSGVVFTLDSNLPFPFKAQVLGEPVEVIGLDERRSELRRGVIALVRKGGKEYRVALSEVQVPENFQGLKWLEMYEFYVEGALED